ncbi:MAG: hypothetical protein WA865_19620, partial [Spirulinaceae cyanobacterium]
MFFLIIALTNLQLAELLSSRLNLFSTPFNQPALAPEVVLIKARNNKPLPYLPTEEEIYENFCQEVPVGIGIPGFKPGIKKQQVLQMFGTPAEILPGYWQDTIAVSYDLIPNRVSLGFLFDKESKVLRQTEAAFANSVKFKTVLATLNSMLGCQLNEEIKQGLRQVWQDKNSQYYFNLNTLEGIVHWEKRDRLYIG